MIKTLLAIVKMIFSINASIFIAYTCFYYFLITPPYKKIRR